MFYSFFILPFLIIVLQFLFPFSNANPFNEDKMLIAFIKGQQEIQFSDYSMQKYEAFLGFMYFMRMNWQCDKIANEFKEYERTECQKYRKYLDILYEYLHREYAGIPTVKPKFIVRYDNIDIDGPIIYALNCLVRISQFYFTSYWSGINKYKLHKLFYHFFEPKLLNEKRLNYEIKKKNEPKLPINEMILQLAIDTANEWQTNESLDGIIRQKFDKNLEEMFKKAEGIAKEDEEEGEEDEEEEEEDEEEGEVEEGDINTINNDKHWIIVGSKFDDKWTWTEDALFSGFVKGLATNFGKFFKMAKEYSNYLFEIKEKGNIYGNDRVMVNFGLYEIEKMKEHLTQKYEAHLGFLYLMQKKWHCKKIVKEIKEKCQKYRKYLHILYEYLFRLYVEAKNPKVSKQLPPLVKPIFIGEYFPESLIEVVESLNYHSNLSWEKDENSEYKFKLVNEEELNFEIEGANCSYKIMLQKGKQILKGQTDIERIRKEFEQQMEKMYEKAKENAKFEIKKLEKAIKNAANIEEKKHLRDEYNEKFYKFISSPFHKKSFQKIRVPQDWDLVADN